MGIHVIQSQRIDVLVEAMLKTVRKPTSNPFEVLKTQQFIVPSPAIEAWLTQRLAEKRHQCKYRISSSNSWFSMVCLSTGFTR